MPVFPEIMILPSMTCPASCAYCFGPHDGPIASRDVMDRILDWIAFLPEIPADRPVRVTLHGGEPLTLGRPALEYMFQGLSDRLGGPHRVAWALQSNLWAMDRTMAGLMADFHVRVGTSLDGPQDITDAQRGRGYFARTRAGMECLMSQGIKAACIATVTSQSGSRRQEILDFFIEDETDFSVHPAIQGLGKTHGYGLSPDQYGGLLCGLLDDYLPFRHRIRIPTLDRLCRAVAFQKPLECTFRPCLGLFLVVDPMGYIYSCQRFAGHREYALGHVSQNPDVPALLDSPVARWLNQWQQDRESGCRGCPDLNICNGGCPYQAVSPNPASPLADPYCRAYQQIFSHIRQKLSQEIASDENIQAMTEIPWNGQGNPLFSRGPVIDLVRSQSHPKTWVQNSRTILRAHRLGCHETISAAASALVAEGIDATPQQSEDRLNQMLTQMRKPGRNTLYLHITWRCGLACNHCYAQGPGKTNGLDMAVADLEEAAVSAAGLGFRQVVLTGGEPSDHPFWNRILKQLTHIRRTCPHVKWALRTHLAGDLTLGDMALMAAAFDKIVVSLDGDQAVHDARRGPGAYQRTVNHIRQYQEQYGPDSPGCLAVGTQARLELACTQTPESLMGDPGRHVASLARHMGIQKTRMRPVLPLGRASGTGLALSPIRGIALDDPERVLVRGLEPVLTCGLGQNLSVDPDGTVFPCHAARSEAYLLGNLFSGSMDMEQILGGLGNQFAWPDVVDGFGLCRPCEFRYLCGGMCLAWHDLLPAPFEPEIHCRKQYGFFKRLTGQARACLEAHHLLKTTSERGF